MLHHATGGDRPPMTQPNADRMTAERLVDHGTTLSIVLDDLETFGETNPVMQRALAEMGCELLRELDAVRRELGEATQVDPASRSHECRECRGGLRKPLKDCPDCCGTAIEGTGLRRHVIALTRERDAAKLEYEREHAMRLQDLDDISRLTDDLAKAQQERDAARQITDEMVERAADEVWRDCDCCTVAGSKITARRALTAAFGVPR